MKRSIVWLLLQLSCAYSEELGSVHTPGTTPQQPGTTSSAGTGTSVTPQVPAAFQASCTSSLDCQSGWWCRDRGDGAEVCMGEGVTNFYCQTSGDCASGYWCRDLRPPFKVCMGNGRTGDFCSSSIDCVSGLWCKERSDGLKVCG